MDGAAPDADLVFVLTTNRADLLEPALAARPGRVDVAIEVDLPDADARRRLLALYGRSLPMRLTDGETDEVIERTDGVTASFIKELLRRAMLESVHRGPGSLDSDGRTRRAGARRSARRRPATHTQPARRRQRSGQPSAGRRNRDAPAPPRPSLPTRPDRIPAIQQITRALADGLEPRSAQGRRVSQRQVLPTPDGQRRALDGQRQPRGCHGTKGQSAAARRLWLQHVRRGRHCPCARNGVGRRPA